jgi:hypothetical protein
MPWPGAILRAEAGGIRNAAARERASPNLVGCSGRAACTAVLTCPGFPLGCSLHADARLTLHDEIREIRAGTVSPA